METVTAHEGTWTKVLTGRTRTWPHAPWGIHSLRGGKGTGTGTGTMAPSWSGGTHHPYQLSQPTVMGARKL